MFRNFHFSVVSSDVCPLSSESFSGRKNHKAMFEFKLEAVWFCNFQGRVFRKPFNANPGLKVN